MADILSTRQIERRRLVRDFLEMVAAMVGGMLVFGGLVSLVCALTGHQGLFEHAGSSAPIMATNMTAGMAPWMWHRGHNWTAIGEMAAAMYVPLVVLLVPFWVGLLPGGVLLAEMHVLMLPAMWLAMLRRRDEYTHDRREVVSVRPLARVR
jgi:hypothetical protein